MPLSEVENGGWWRNALDSVTARRGGAVVDKYEWQSVSGDQLRRLSDSSFTPKAERSEIPRFGYFMTTELCHLSCVMCHFNGPKATRRGAETLDPELVVKVLRSRPAGEQIWFVSTAEFFNDPNALSYIKTAAELGLSPRAITHGQMLVPKFIEEIMAAGIKERGPVALRDEVECRCKLLAPYVGIHAFCARDERPKDAPP